MANKVAPKISGPGSGKFPQRGPHNPNVGTHGSGLAPKPSGGAALMGNDRPSQSTQAGLARVKNVGSGFKGFRLPLQSPKAGISGKQVGQSEADPGGPGISKSPMTSMPVTGNPVATNKPKRRGIGSKFYGEY